MNIPRVTGPQH